MLNLPDPPTTLATGPRAFYDELREMLAVVRATDVDQSRVEVQLDDRGGLDLTLSHARESDWSITAEVEPDGAVVAVGPSHEHFDELSEVNDRPWPVDAVDFIAGVLRGEFEIDCVYRGRTLTEIRHYVRDENGRHFVGMTGLIRPAQLMIWKARRTQTIRFDFGARG